MLPPAISRRAHARSAALGFWLEDLCTGAGKCVARNLAFYVDGEVLLGLTPVYDMTAMFYAPQRGNLPEARYAFPTPAPLHSKVWRTAYAAARDLWQAVAEHEQVSGPS